MEVCRFCNSTQVAIEDDLAQCSDCYRSWINKISAPFDDDVDDLFGDLDDLLPKKKKEVVKTPRKKKGIKRPRLNISASSAVKESDTFFSDMDESDEEPIKAQKIEEIKNDKNDKEESEDEYVVMNNVNREDNEYDLDFSELDESEKEDEIPQPTKMKRKSRAETGEKPKKGGLKPTNQFNPFILFNKEMRAKLKLENPELGNIQLSKYIGKQWKALSPTEKKAYNELSERKREAYKNRPIRFVKPPKPPPNVWIFYTKEELPKIRAQYPQMSINDASKIASHNWKGLSKEEQDVYRDMAKKAKDEFEKKYPKEALDLFKETTKEAQKPQKNNKKKKN